MAGNKKCLCCRQALAASRHFPACNGVMSTGHSSSHIKVKCPNTWKRKPSRVLQYARFLTYCNLIGRGRDEMINSDQHNTVKCIITALFVYECVGIFPTQFSWLVVPTSSRTILFIVIEIFFLDILNCGGHTDESALFRSPGQPAVCFSCAQSGCSWCWSDQWT